MSRTIRVTPSGRLLVEPKADAEPALPPAVAQACEAAFAESSAQGLQWLASQSLETRLPATLLYWRQFAERYYHDVCQIGAQALQSGGLSQLPSLTEAEYQNLVATAPPMRGLEYLTVEVLDRLWRELNQWTLVQASQHPQGAEAYLREVNPVWHLVGRVTLHLAENKRDPKRPFAFLAAYAHRVSARARLQHLPLGQALKEYAGARDRAKLTQLLEPVQRAAAESPLVRELLESRALFQPQAWTIHQAHRFLLEVPRMEAAGVVVRVPDWWSARKPPRPQVRVQIGNRRAAQLGLDSLLDFKVDIALEGESLTAAERRQLLNATEDLVLLRGKWVEVDRARLQEALQQWQDLEEQHADGLNFIDGMRLLAGTQIGSSEREEKTADWSQVVAGDWLRDTLRVLRDPSQGIDLQPGTHLQATLRPYQAEGVRWLWFLTRLGIGACLADDMGLGKTIQVIDLLLQLKHAPGAAGGPSLLVVPASLIGNWKQELQRFAPDLRVFFAHRSESDAEALNHVAARPESVLRDFDLVITTYGLVRRSDWFREMNWRLVLLDEAQAIKNPSSAQTRSIKKLRGAGRIVLTGTPVENDLADLWSIFDFTCPGLLGSMTGFKQFIKRLNKDQDAQAFGALRRLVQPYILRRLKTDPKIVPDLPAKTEMRAECGLSKRQAALYERAVKDLARRLEDASGIGRRGLVLSVLMQLKQICNHPSQYLNQSDFAPRDSGKFTRLAEICTPIFERQEKMLVFTQFQTLCQPLAEYLAELFGQTGLVLTGKTPVRKRSELVRQFQADDGPPFLVISVKAGGSGLNLTAASHVVHFDRWWNPAVENQATDRAFRIGQKRNVLVHKFVCRGTVEERVDQMLRDKQELADKLLAQGGETMLTEMSDEELLGFVAIDLDRATAE